MGLQIDIMQNAANRRGANRRDDLVMHRLAGQVLAGPVRDVQALGYRLQTGEFNDLCPLHGGNLLWVAGIALPAVSEQTCQTMLTITITSSPNRGFVTFKPSSDRTLTFPAGDGHHYLGPLHLKPGQGTAVGSGMQSILIRSSNCQFLWLASTHEATSHLPCCQGPLFISIADSSNSLQVL
jgi:hypothetical protein